MMGLFGFNHRRTQIRTHNITPITLRKWTIDPVQMINGLWVGRALSSTEQFRALR